MSFTVGALVVGVALGFATGGRVSNVDRRSLELVWMLVASVAIQAAAEVLDVPDSAGLAMVLISYVGLTGFAFANVRLVGMPVVIVGLVCNIVVIAANGGMPVRAESILASRAATSDELDTLDFGAKRHLEDERDVIVFLGDIIPVRPTREVLSFGDLILAFGVADVVFRLLRPFESRRRRRDETDEADEVVVVDAADTIDLRDLVDA
jgi:hypothetical protein